MKIEVPGTGCSMCKSLYEAVRAAVKEKRIEAEIVKAQGVVNFSLGAKRVSGVVMALAGVWFIWQGF